MCVVGVADPLQVAGVLAGADRGAAGAGELGVCALLAGGGDHAHLLRRQIVYRTAQVEVAVHDRAEAGGVASPQRRQRLVDQRRLAGHRFGNGGIVLHLRPVAHHVVYGAGRLGKPLVPGNEQQRQQVCRQRYR